MISGTSDDRIAFVIETQAQLDGIRAARAEVRGLGTDAQSSASRMSAASQNQAQSIAAISNMSAKSRAAFDSMDMAGKKAALSLMGVSESEQKAALGAAALSGAIADNTTQINMSIGAFIKRGEFIDKTSTAAITAYRAEGDALSANLARLGATEQELNRIGSAITRVEQKGGAAMAFGPQLGPALPPGGIVPPGGGQDQITTIPGKARTAANALAMLSQAAITGQGSMQGALVAAGGLSTGLAGLSKSAAIAAAASGIGAVVTIAGVAAMALYHMGDAAKATKQDIEHLNSFTAQTMPEQIASLRQARDLALQTAAAAAGGADESGSFLQRMLHKRQPGEGLLTDLADTFGLSSPALRAFQKLDDLYGQAIPKSLALARNERLRLVALGDQVKFQTESNDLQLEAGHRVEGVYDAYKRQVSQLYLQLDLQKQGIERQFMARDEQGHVIALTAEQIRQKQKLLEQTDELGRLQLNELIHARELADIAYHQAAKVAASEGPLGGRDVAAQYQAKLDQINAEAAAELETYPERAIDIEAQKQAKIRALRRETQKQAMDDAKQITAVLIDSGSKQIKAVGHAAETLRRVVIGAQAAHAAVEAAIEGGKAIGSLATGDFRGAALHGAAAIELAKAAALGAQESLGGGGGASSTAGGGGGNAGTFEPRTGTEGQGAVVINVYSQNPYGAEQIQQVKYLLNRADILKTPAAIQIAPTTGLRAA